jgi:serine/threonine-protein kinase
VTDPRENATPATSGEGVTIALPGGGLPPALRPVERYELHGEIARGGMGVVFAARDRALSREVAVKVLRAEVRDNGDIARRFVEEALITGQLQHPGVPPIHDLGTLPDGRPFIAMKLIKGRTLAALLGERRAVEHTRYLTVFEQVCQAVAYAHSKGVIHRDIKPSNVMVGAFGEVQVMDWGLAKVLDQESHDLRGPHGPANEGDSEILTGRSAGLATQAGSMLGTPAYMPPEQARGELHRTDRREDVFALGALLCEILTGRPPYTGTRAEVMARAQAGDVAQAMERLDCCGADAGVVALAKRCLSPRPEDRPAEAATVAAAVAGRMRRGEAERAAEAHRREKIWRSLWHGLLDVGGVCLKALVIFLAACIALAVLAFTLTILIQALTRR